MVVEEIFVDAESEEKIDAFKEREKERLRNLTVKKFDGTEVNLYDEARKFWNSPQGKKAIREAVNRNI